MLIQIYEIGSPQEAHALSAMGVDHIGILVGDGRFPREQSIAAALPIMSAIGGGVKSSVLCLSPDIALLRRALDGLRPDILHLGCAPHLLEPEAVADLKRHYPEQQIMRSIPVGDESSIVLARSYEAIADFLLLDSYDAGDNQIGATGATHNWDLDRRIVESVRIPVIVAGGLGPDNARAAIAAARPAGVDSKTRTDKPDGSHTKDLARVRAFVAAVHGFGSAADPD
ncbi:MAG TPA: phosphoribosylanthranilate isomerase [Rhizomicrobium sp.]|jgi:phosphoribosylanthranilate isomerase